MDNKSEVSLIEQLPGIDLDGDMLYTIDPETFETKKKQYVNVLKEFWGK